MPTTTRLQGGELAELEQLSARAAPAVGQPHNVSSASQPILSIRATVPAAGAEEFIAEALHAVRAYMQEHHVRPVGPPFSICRPRGSSVDVEAGWPTAKPLTGTGRIHGGALPAALGGMRSEPWG